MKKVLSFCVLSVLLAVLSLGLKAQSGLVLDPANMPNVVLNQYDTIYISANSECFDSLGLAADDRVSIEWKVLYNGSVIPEDSLSYYFEDFKFESRYDLGMAEKWWGRSYTSHYCQNGNGYGSYPGANTPTGGLELGQQCEDPGHFLVSQPGQNNPYQFDFFFVRWFKDENSIPHRHRLVYNIKVDGDYEIIFSIAQRCGGTVWQQIYVGSDEHYQIGGHQSVECGILSSDTLHSFAEPDITDYYRCVGDSLVLGNPAVTFKVSTDTTIDPGYDSVFYMGVSSCNGAIDSIIRFRVFFEDPSVPVLDTLNSTLVLCDSGQVSILVTTTAADKCIWLDETLAVLDTLDASAAFTKDINANAQFYVLGYNSASGCVSSDTLTVYAEVFASPNPVVTATPDTLCENSTLQITLDREYDAWTWFHDGTDMALDTIVYDVADAATTDAGQYWAIVSENHVHSVYPTIDTIACSASDTALVVVFERPSVAWATFDGNAVMDSMTLCPNDLEHVLVATISGGQAPYDNIHWTGFAGTETYNADKSSDTLSLTLANTCGAEYTSGIDYAVDSNGCTLKDTIKITFFVNDTIKPTVAKTKDTTSLQKYADCEYIIPNVMSIITTSDNCGLADTTQVPAAGEFVTTDTIVIVTVTDLCGNTASDTINVLLPVDELVIDTIEVTATVLCAGDANGAIRVTVEGGTAPYDVKITHHTVTDSVYTQHGAIDQTIFDFAGLIAGKWDIEVTDTNGCQVVVNDTADVAAPDILTLTTSDWTDLTCFESNDGSFKFNVKQGTTPYEVKIVRTLGSVSDSVEMTLNPSVLDTIVTMENQKAGVYVISVVDGHGCTASATDTITQPDQLVLVGDTVLNHVKCFGESNGNLAVTEVTGGTYPYYYAWVNEAGDTVSTDSVTGRILPAGAYTIYITDANNCTPNQVLTDTIKQPERALNVVSINAPVSDTCPRLHTYTFDATVEGGRPNYEFEWTFNSVVAQTTPNVAAVVDTFNYIEATISCDTTFEIIFKVTDDSACVAMDTISFTIADTVAPTLTGILDTLYIDGCAATDAGDTLNTVAKLQTAGLTIADNCTAVDALTVNYSEVVTPGCPIEVVRTYSVTDSCGLTSAEVKHVIYVQDTTRPTYTRPNDTILYLSDACTVDTVAANVGVPTNLADNCTAVADLVVSHRDEVVAGCGSTYTISRYWKVVDACGNVSLSDSIQTIEVQDTTPPTFTTLPVSKSYPCDGSGDTILLKSYKNTMASAVAADNCALDSIAMNLDSIVTGCNSATLTYYFSFTAVDFCGNKTTEYATFSIYDSVAPTFTRVADDIVMECSIDDLDTIRIHSLADFQYDDACSHNAAFVSDSLSEFTKDCGSTGFYTHYVTITDSCQTATRSHLISIVDTKDPVFTQAPTPNPVVECDGSGNIDELFSWLYSVSAMDSCSGPIDSITVFYVNTLGENVIFDTTAARDGLGHFPNAWRPVEDHNCEGFYRFIWKAVDSCGNFVTTTEDFRIIDHAGPEFTQTRPDTTVECGYDRNEFFTWLQLTDAVDVCTGATFAVTVDTVFHEACGHTGYYRVKWSVSDSCGNNTDPIYADWTVIDTTSPDIVTLAGLHGNLLPDTIYRASDSPFGAAEPEAHYILGMDELASIDFVDSVLAGGVLTDVDNHDFVIHNSAGITAITDCGWIKEFWYVPTRITTGKACVEEWNIEFRFIDDCGNPITLTQELYIMDTSAPVVKNIIDLKYLLGPDAACAPEPVDTFRTIRELQQYSPTGANHADPDDYLLDLDGIGYITLDSVTAGTPSVAFPCDSVEVRHYTIKDMCDNAKSFTHTITFRDTIAPRLNLTEILDSVHQKEFGSCNLYSEIENGLFDSLKVESFLYDHYGLVIEECQDFTITEDGAITYETNDQFCPGKVIVKKYKVTEDCGSVASKSTSFTVKLVVKDTIAPVAAGTPLHDSTVYSDDNCDFTLPNVQFTEYAQLKAWNGGGDVYNDCNLGDDSRVAVYGPVYGGNGCDSTFTYKFTVADSCDNMSRDTVTITIHVLDTLAPNVTVAQATVVDTQYYELDCSIPTLNYWNNGQDALNHGVEMTDCNPAWDDNTKLVRLDETNERDVCTTIYTVRYQVKDACTDHVSDTIYQTIVILDTVAPVVSPDALKDTLTYMVDDASDCWGPAVPYFTNVGEVKAYDNTFNVVDCNVGDDSQVRLEREDSSDVKCVRTVVRTYVVLDSCGLVSNEFTQTIQVSDTTAPAITAALTPQQVFMDINCNFTYTTYTTIADLPTDMQNGINDCNLKDELIHVSADTLEIGATDCEKAFTVFVTYQAQDSCGNVKAFNDTIYVADTIAPVVTGTLDTLTLYLTDVCTYTVPAAYTNTDELIAHGVTVTDCKLRKDLTVSDVDTLAGYCPMLIHRTYTVSDSCGHTTTFGEFFHVTDTFAPNVTDNTVDTVVLYIAADSTYTVPAAFTTVTELIANNAALTDCNLVDVIDSVHADTTINAAVCDGSFVIRKYFAVDSCDNMSEPIIAYFPLTDTVAPWLDVTLPAYDAERTATACEFLVPNLHDTIAAHYVDNWSAFTAYDQVPAAGYAITNFRDTVVMVAFGDVCGNMDTVYVNINVPDSLKITSLTMSEPNCYDESNGTITVEITGGVADYIYSYDVPAANDTISALTTTFNDIHANFYTVTVTDANGCTAQDTITVTQPTEVVITPYVANFEICDNEQPEVSLSVTGGTADYTILATLLDNTNVVVDTLFNEDAATYTMNVVLDSGSFYIAFYGIDDHGCIAADTSALITVHPTYLIEQTARVCHSDIVDLGSYTWVDNNGQVRKGGPIDASNFPVADSIYTLYDSLHTVGYLCDSVYVLHLNVTDKPYLKVRPLPAVYTPDISNAVEEIPVRTFTTDSVNVGWEIFVDKNCMKDACKNPQIRVSLDYELYRFDPEDSVYVLMPDVSIYFKPEYRTFLDIYGMNYMPSSASHVSCPSVYQNSGFNQEFDYYYLCWLDPEYNTSSSLFPSNSTLMSNGWYYQDGRANTIRITEFLVGGDYKIKVTLNKREGGTHWGHTTVPMTGGGYPGGYDGSYVVEPYVSSEIFFHVDGPSMPAPHPIAPIGGSVVYSSGNDDPEANVYPNPARDYVTVEFTGFEGQTNVMLSNTDGKNLRNIELDIDDAHTTNIVKIETGEYAQGVYLVTVRNNDAIITKRVVIIR